MTTNRGHLEVSLHPPATPPTPWKVSIIFVHITGIGEGLPPRAPFMRKDLSQGLGQGGLLCHHQNLDNHLGNRVMVVNREKALKQFSIVLIMRMINKANF